MLSFPELVVTFEGVDFELVEGYGLFHVEKHVLDALRQSVIEFTVEGGVIPPHESSMLGEFDHVLIDMVVLLHFEGMEGPYGGLSQIGFPKIPIQGGNELGPVAPNGRFRLSK